MSTSESLAVTAPASALPARAYETVVTWVEGRVLSGGLRVGDLIPAERDLAAQLGVSRSAVREAVRALHAMGIVDSRVGAGASGGTVITAVPTGVLTRFLRMHVALAQFPVIDVVDVRCSLESLSAQLAAQQATTAQLEGLDLLLAAMEAPNLSREQFNDYDTDFHVAIARAAGNSLATDLTVAIRESVRGPIRDGLVAIDDWSELREVLCAEHRAIAVAIRAGDGGLAAELLDAHIRSAAGAILLNE